MLKPNESERERNKSVQRYICLFLSRTSLPIGLLISLNKLSFGDDAMNYIMHTYNTQKDHQRLWYATNPIRI